MDNLTHTLFGWTLARAGLGRGVPYATATLILASNAPDLDIVTALASGTAYLGAHRGPTHGPLGVVGLGLVTSGVVAVWARWRRPREAARATGDRLPWMPWLGLAMIGIVGHVLMDLPTAYGTRPLSPFDWTWYALDWMPIVDVYLWLVLAGGLALGYATGRRQWAALVALALMLADYGGRATLHERALDEGALRTASGNERPCADAPTLVRHPRRQGPAATAPDACLAAAALPTFVSPFVWRVIRQSPSGYEISDRHVFDRSTIGSIALESETGPVITQARNTDAGRVYLDFARFPLARVADRSLTTATVRLFDARFVGLPAGADTARLPDTLSFTITVDTVDRPAAQRFGH